MTATQRTGSGSWRSRQSRDPRRKNDQLKQMLFWVREYMPSDEAYEAWYATLPEKWYDALVVARAKYVALRQPVILDDDCTCTPISNACVACITADKVRYGEEIPV